jgi:hypothetical protein
MGGAQSKGWSLVMRADHRRCSALDCPDFPGRPPGSEVDAHDDAPRRHPGDLGEASGGERALGADVQLV